MYAGRLDPGTTAAYQSCMNIIRQRPPSPSLILLGLLLCFAGPGSAEAPAAQPTVDAPHALIVLTSHPRLGDTGEPTGFYLSEASQPWDVFTKQGYTVTLASPNGGPAPIDPGSLDLNDPVNAAFLEAVWREQTPVPTLAIETVDPDAVDVVFVAGGHGTMWDLPDHEPLQQLLAGVYENGGVVAAVCHGPAALVNVRLSNGDYLVNGHRVAAFTNEEEEAVELTDTVPFLLETLLRERGAEFVPGEKFQANVVVSERLVTGQNPASARGTAQAIVDLLRD